MGSRVATSLPTFGFGAIVVAAIAVPTVFSPSFADPFMVAKATVLWAASIAVLVGLGALVATSQLPPRPSWWVVGPAAVLVGWTTLALVASDAPATSWWGSHGRYDGLLTLTAAVVLAAGLVALAWRDLHRLEIVAAAIAVSGVLGVGYVLLERLGWGGVDWQLQGTQGWVVGLGGNPNFSGAHLALVVPIVLAARLRTPDPRARLALLGLVAALVLGIWATGTRGGLVALVGGTAVTGILVPEVLPRAVRALAVVATVVLLAGVAITGATEELPGPDRLDSTSALQVGAILQRTNIWAGATSMIAAHPLTGVGPDGFGRALPEHRSSRGELQLIYADEAHNVFLDRAATAGLPALGAHLALLGGIVGSAWRARRRLPEEHRWLLGAFGGLLGGYVLQGLFSIDTIPLALLGWLAAGALVALTDPAMIAARAEGTTAPSTTSVPGAVAVVGGVLGAVLLVLAVRPVIADLHHQRGRSALRAGDAIGALRHDGAASSWASAEPRYLQAQAEDLVAAAVEPSIDPGLRRTLLGEAVVAYDRALDRAPRDPRLVVARAQVEVLASAAAVAEGDDEAALEHLAAGEKALRTLIEALDATDDLHLPYGRLLQARAELEAAQAAGGDRTLALAGEQLALARRYRPHEVDATIGLAQVALAQGRREEARRLVDEAVELGGDDPEQQAAIRELERRISADGG